MKTLYVLAVFAFTLGVLAGAGPGCVPQTVRQASFAVENAAALAQYRQLLQPCKEKAIDAGDIAVFDKCAAAVDAMLCSVNPAFCPDGGV